MSTPTADRPDAPDSRPLPDDLDRAYRDASAIADGERGPAPAVRASVLAAAREIARRSASATISEAGAGRAEPANRPAWRLRAGAAACVALITAVTAWQLNGGRPRDADVTTVASAADPSPSPALVPAPAAAPALTEAVAPVAAPARIQGPEPSTRLAPVARSIDNPLAKSRATPTAPSAAPPVADQSVPAQEAPEVVASAKSDFSGRQARVMSRAMAPPVVALAAAPAAPAVPAATMAPAAPAAMPRPQPVPSALQRAADDGDVAQIDALLARPGTRVDAADGDGRTALLHAVLAQRTDAVRALVAAGADPDRADHAGLTPRAAAQAAGRADIAALLVR